MGVLELMNVADAGEVLAVLVGLALERAYAFEETFVRFINLHQLQIYYDSCPSVYFLLYAC